MKLFFILLLGFFLSVNTFAQKTETVYLNENDSTKNYYLIAYPGQIPWKAYLFLIPSLGESPQHVWEQSGIAKKAVQSGILTIIPIFESGPFSLGFDSLTQVSFKKILDHVTSRHKLIDQRLLVGGFSIGGTCAVKFAELAFQKNYTIKPAAVFGIDPPLDFERLFNAASRTIRLTHMTSPNQEPVYLVNRLKQEMNGTPVTSQQTYWSLSPFSANDSSQAQIKFLSHTPLTLYSEPDVNWWISMRGQDFYSMNVIDAAAMINELKMMGNTDTRLILTQNKGYRQPGNQRHPHAWSIADPDELINWLLAQK